MEIDFKITFKKYVSSLDLKKTYTNTHDELGELLPHHSYNENYTGGMVLKVYSDTMHADNSLLFKANSRVRYVIINNTLVCHTLLPKKRLFKEGNYAIAAYDIVYVGEKRPTTHLPHAFLFLFKRKKFEK